MLKAIELIGFKSFADKTRLEFEEGISALVGPNGSGKSNIVDAIKWVLGEQSIKKLRGNEMTDVIFGGSGSRQALGAAEVTLSFDNSAKIFDLDASEIHITRRVYRSGASEYLINRQNTKLKNIRELLSGTGLGAQALSIIEQGRVQSLLESAPIQRRAIFDEAAGVSRFNVKKLESQRRLERVEQNLLRLSDTLKEEENRLRNTKAQAGKAQLYRQYTGRLQELRTQSSLLDWRRLRERSEKIGTEIEESTAEEKRCTDAIELFELTLRERNETIEQKDATSKKLAGEIAAVGERILGEESAIELQIAQLEEIESEISHNGRYLIEMNLRSVDTEEMMRKTDEDIISARTYHKDVSEEYRKILGESEFLATEFERTQADLVRIGKQVETENRNSSRLLGHIGGIEAKIETLLSNRENSENRLREAESNLEVIVSKIRELEERCESLRTLWKKRENQFESSKRKKIERERELESILREISACKEKRSGMGERISVLEELLEAHEGLSPGVSEVLKLARNPESPYRFAHGLVADILNVESEHARLIELALGHSAQHVVVSPEPELFRHIERNSKFLPGRVGFIWLDPNQVETSWMKNKGFEGRPGVIGRADRFVDAPPEYAHLAARLLGRTWIVENISIAKSLYRESDDRTNFLTVEGEYLASDGSIELGPITASSGIITRRTELRTLKEELDSLDGIIRELKLSREVLKSRLTEDENRTDESDRMLREARLDFDTSRNEFKTLDERRKLAEKQHKQRSEEYTVLLSKIEEARSELAEANLNKTILQEMILGLENDLSEAEKQFEAADLNKREHARKASIIHIEVAKSEERLNFLQDRIRQFEDRQKERRNQLEENGRRLKILKDRRDATTLSILRIESGLAGLYVRKEKLIRESHLVHSERESLANERKEFQSHLRSSQEELSEIRTKKHSKQLEFERLQQEQKTLSSRMMEDYNVDLERMDLEETKIESGPVPEESNENAEHLSPEDYRAEIDLLRQKIKKIGNVNLEAIEALEELESRFTTHSNQYNDLISAKSTVEKIIEKTNSDCQSLFEETFEGVKHHFRELFQRFFGGGYADIVFEDPDNPLESGIDIVARPPGKELSSIMLMSGGEKTLTCVALLLAFFKYRPNPVCILDEVDAALDEGNIDRFVNVVSDFRTSTQFLIVTHSKKTMACASTIYGITMQDSGVSKPISVRFCDVGEDGEILDRSEEEKPSIFKIDSENRTKAAG